MRHLHFPLHGDALAPPKDSTPGYMREELLNPSIESFAAPVLLHEQVMTEDVHMRNVTVPTSYDSDVQYVEPLVSKKGHVKVELVEETWEESEHTRDKWILGKLEKDSKTDRHVLTWTVHGVDEPNVDSNHPIAVKHATGVYVSYEQMSLDFSVPRHTLTYDGSTEVVLMDKGRMEVSSYSITLVLPEQQYLQGPIRIHLGDSRLDHILETPDLQYKYSATFQYPLHQHPFLLTVPLGERKMMLGKLQRYYTNQLFLRHTEEKWVPIQFKDETTPRTLPPGTYRFRDSEQPQFTVSKYADSVTLRADDVVQRVLYYSGSPRWTVTTSQQHATPKWIPFDLDQDYLPLTGQTYSFDRNCTTKIDSTQTDVEWWGPRPVHDSECAARMLEVNDLVGAQNPAACRALNFLLVPPAQCNPKDGIVKFSQPSPSLLDMTTIPPKTKLNFKVTHYDFNPVFTTGKKGKVVEGTLQTTTTFQINPTIEWRFRLKWPRGTSIPKTQWENMWLSTKTTSRFTGNVTKKAEPAPPQPESKFYVKRIDKDDFTMTGLIKKKLIQSMSTIHKHGTKLTEKWFYTKFSLYFPVTTPIQVTPQPNFNLLYTTERTTFIEHIKLQQKEGTQQYDVIYNKDKLVMTLGDVPQFIIPGSEYTVDNEQDSFIRAICAAIDQTIREASSPLRWKYHTKEHGQEISASGGAPFAQIKSKEKTQLEQGEAYYWNEQKRWLPQVTKYVGESPSETLIRTDVRDVGKEEGKFDHMSKFNYLPFYDSIYTTEYGTQMVKLSDERTRDIFYKADHFYHYPGKLSEIDLSTRRSKVNVWKDGHKLDIPEQIAKYMYTIVCPISKHFSRPISGSGRAAPNRRLYEECFIQYRDDTMRVYLSIGDTFTTGPVYLSPHTFPTEPDLVLYKRTLDKQASHDDDVKLNETYNFYTMANVRNGYYLVEKKPKYLVPPILMYKPTRENPPFV